MTLDLLHPEDLLDREQQGGLSPDERERLHAHLLECEACRLERALRQSVALPLTEDDDQLLARAADQAADRFLRPSKGRFSVSMTRWGALAAGFAAVGIAFAAGAAVWPAVAKRFETPTPVPPAAVATPLSDRGPRAPAAPRPAAESTTDPEGPVTTAPAHEAPVPAAAERQSDSPGDLFARANHARRQGETAAAAELYRDLQTRFPRSNEALVSRVTLGRLMLDRLSQPSRALGQFESYLTAVPRGGLREEAIIGRALALGQMGRVAEEQRAWRMLVEEFPDSMYSERARSRLEGRAP
jgi:TolA-binding protein